MHNIINHLAMSHLDMALDSSCALAGQQQYISDHGADPFAVCRRGFMLAK
jgi:hypothetical protein